MQDEGAVTGGQADGTLPATARPAPAAMPPLTRRLASKLLLLTILFVLVAEVLIFVPSIANFRQVWLRERLQTAGVAALLITQSGTDALPRAVQDEVLMATGAKAIALREKDSSRILVVDDMPVAVDLHVDLGVMDPVAAISAAFDTMLNGGDRILRVFGPVGDPPMQMELITSEKQLRAAMFVYARNVAILSVIISLITAALVFMAINTLMIRPVRRMTLSMLRYSAAPDDPASIIRPGERRDELGIAERELSAMQARLQETLKNQKHLADLGLAVSKINHDMRNILASAQLMSDRLGEVADPAVQRFAPRLMRAIGRAVSYSEDVLAYGRAQEATPKRRQVRLRDLVDDVHGLLGIDQGSGIVFANTVPADCEIDADPDQLFRIVLNLCRNAVQALSADTDPATVRRITVSAGRMGQTTILSVRDTGPGLPAKAREHLFSAFRGSARQGGTGLGLAIAHELVRAHGGTIELRNDGAPGAHFEVRIPDAPRSLKDFREERQKTA